MVYIYVHVRKDLYIQREDCLITIDSLGLIPLIYHFTNPFIGKNDMIN